VSAWEVLGWVGNACFFARFFIQWLQSERAQRSVTPASFWWLSLAGAVCCSACALGEGELVLIPVFLVNTCIYLRNLWIGNKEENAQGRGGLGPVLVGILGILAASAVLILSPLGQDWNSGVATGWLVAGVVGQAIWGTRFLVQWWCSERAGRSYFPAGFWWFTLAGSVGSILYTAQLENPVFLVGYLPTPIYPIRNLMLERKRRRTSSAS
jgi:lipid-A-disaccharide synthase